MCAAGCLGLLAGCFSTSDSNDDAADEAETGCPVGAETCPCTSGGVCDEGLQCLSGICVADDEETGSSDGSSDESSSEDAGTVDTETSTSTDTNADMDSDTDSDTDSETGMNESECDPLLQDCPMGEGCYFTFMSDVFVCADVGMVPINEGCGGTINVCAPGLACINSDALSACEADGCCAAYCDLEDPTCPIMGTECAPFPWEGTAPQGLESVGLCVG